MPGSRAEWPASGTMTYSASGQARCRSSAEIDRADGVVASLDDGARQVPDAPDVGEKGVVRQENVVDEIVRLDPRDRERHGVVVEMRDQLGIGQQRRARALVAAPRVRGGHMDRGIAIDEPAVVVAEQVRAFDRGQELRERAAMLRGTRSACRTGTSGSPPAGTGRCRAARARARARDALRRTRAPASIPTSRRRPATARRRATRAAARDPRSGAAWCSR